MDADKNQPGVQELKEWIGVMEYIRSFPDTNGDGSPDVPDKYRGKLGRMTRQASWNPVSLLSRGTVVTWAAFSILLLVILVVGFVSVFVVKKLKRRPSATSS